MKKPTSTSTPLYSPDEYRRLGHQFKGFMEWCAQTRQLFSMAYPANSPLYLAIVKAHDNGFSNGSGIFSFKSGLEIMAYTDHPAEKFTDDFNQDSQWHYQHPVTLPGCSAEDTALLTAAKERRRFEKKRDPLTLDELKVVTRFLAHVDTICAEIVEKVRSLEEDSSPAAKALVTPWLVIGHAFIVISKELHRVRDEQA